MASHERNYAYSPNPSPYRFTHNQQMAETMRYRVHVHAHIPGVTNDVFDGSNYHHLCNQHVASMGRFTSTGTLETPDVTLGLSTDGFTPFKW